MKKIKKLFATGLFVISTSLLAPPLAYATILESGSICEAANLNQALQGIGWSQGGVTNNATIPFFVVCPLNWDNNATFPDAVALITTFPGSTGTVECTARGQSATGAYTSTSITVSAGQNGVGANRGFDEVAANFTDAMTMTIVCALDPGEGVELVAIG